MEQDGIYAQADLFSSQPSKMNVTDQFYEKPVDVLKKYNGVPNQYHMTLTSVKKSKKMRFLTFIQCHDSKADAVKIEKLGNGQFKIGSWTVKAQLDVNKQVSLFAGNATAQLYVDGAVEKTAVSLSTKSASVLTEVIDGKTHSAVSTDQGPATSY